MNEPNLPLEPYEEVKLYDVERPIPETMFLTAAFLPLYPALAVGFKSDS